MKRALVALLLLGGCQRESANATQPAPTSLEAAAVAAGIVADPAAGDPTGLYARDNDKLCLVPGATGYRIGITVTYGDQYYCTGRGTATRAGEALHVALTSAPGCSFDARFEGDRINLPGALPDACQKACTERASLAGLGVERLSDSSDEAGGLRDRRGQPLCAGD
ncbi:MAG: hypothetical protein J0I47_05040 [Sphingomonas sp.]|uniref:hypothetical protein n=1 Tax=Sphingomonas sp. TaxID=28214 RepID=UPI001ACA849D|nr:hypothetical protein [Sphingomonas sp.]MBN8807590.1 hypothetical protein [Sphingomonas sp.]